MYPVVAVVQLSVQVKRMSCPEAREMKGVDDWEMLDKYTTSPVPPTEKEARGPSKSMQTS
jgi:hypothetical protein